MIDTIFFLLVFFMISTLGRGHDVRLQVHLLETRTYRHSLQYNIRWIMEVRTRDNRFTNRQISRNREPSSHVADSNSSLWGPATFSNIPDSTIRLAAKKVACPFSAFSAPKP